jgi:hypothetical protein
MRPRPLLFVGTAGALALGCAPGLQSNSAGLSTNTYQRAVVLNTPGNNPAIGQPGEWIADVLEARGYRVQAAQWYGQGRTPRGVRLRADGWDQIEVYAGIGDGAVRWESVEPAISYRWTLFARTFATNGVERPVSPEARADLDSVMAALGTPATRRAGTGATTQPEPNAEADSAARRLARCTRGETVGNFIGLPPWAGNLTVGTTADRMARAMTAAGWTVARPPSWVRLMGFRAQPGGSDVVSVLVRAGDRRADTPTSRYEIRAAFCDSTGRPLPARAEAEADTQQLVQALREASAGER